MKKVKILTILSLSILLVTLTVAESKAQKGLSKPEVAKWQSEQDEKSFWEFKNDGKMYATYTGSDVVQIFTYSISDTSPCQEGVSLSVEENVKFLQLIDEQDGSISCFYIYGLNDEILTVMDAQTGHIFPSTRIEE